MLVFSTGATAFADGQASLYYGRAAIDLVPFTDFSTYGGSIGLFGSVVGAEMALEYSPISAFDLGVANLGASMTNVMGNVVLQIPVTANFQPYGTVGYGAFIGSAGLDPYFVARATIPALNFGGGAKFFFNESVGVRVDFRRFSLQAGDLLSDTQTPFGDVGLTIDPDIDRFTAGVAFRF
jgi:hypothetical protein